MTQIKRNTHYIPQLYLRQWSDDGKKLWRYSILVSHERVKEWSFKSIGGIACFRDLYSSVSNGVVTDDFERWIESEYETPVEPVLNKVIRDEKLKPSDWDRLAMFFAVQDLRTPTGYSEMMNYLEKQFPEIFGNTMRKVENRFEQARKEGRTITPTKNDQSFFKDIVKIRIQPNADPESGKALILAEMMAHRKLWLDSQRLLLSTTAKGLTKHKWSIAEPAKGYEWFTCDHPAIKLNCHENGKYDFKGGWGKGSNLILPLSPRHLLFTQFGDEFPDRFNAEELTPVFQKFIAERAYRFIYARKPIKDISSLRPRCVDPQAFTDEEDQIRRYHAEQSLAEGQQSDIKG